jgi:hypothetical protein
MIDLMAAGRALIDAMHDEVLEQIEVGGAQHNRRLADGSYLDHSTQPCRDAILFAPCTR